jgi:hypothetical protein
MEFRGICNPYLNQVPKLTLKSLTAFEKYQCPKFSQSNLKYPDFIFKNIKKIQSGLPRIFESG